MSLPGFLLAGKAVSLTSFFSAVFFSLFLPVSIAGYAVTPGRVRKYYLLLISFGFFWLISGILIAYLLAAILISYGGGLWISSIQKKQGDALSGAEKEQKKIIRKAYVRKQRCVLAFCIVMQAGMLLILKYSGFFLENVNELLTKTGSEVSFRIPSFLMPIGISFFSLQSISYLIDVCRGVIQADKNILRVSLFLSFFPQIVEGPICRYSQTADRLWTVETISYANLTQGIQRYLYGMMKKIVIADRLNPVVNFIYNEYAGLSGGMAALAAVCYTIQLYMDFSGSMDAVIGTAQIFGIQLPENIGIIALSRV